ncbi:MAG: carbon storage regulator [Abditibacteriota bacterium]|nr:carbon storage regulator [Abditibacteriota bacterium]MBP5093666.1 carbon storage regulator [Abditibacteriota bacterium]MBP5718822.1 carbon storage regulator [Abditibacteriota bacterium]MBP5737757.1 carbon storage regulator [Abditibacteriota bacterium]
MLVLTTKTGQGIKIGDNIEVTVIEARGNQVRLGITAPKDIAVTRAKNTKDEKTDRE